MHVLVVTAVEAEKAAVLRGLKGASRFAVLAAGVGPIAAAAGTAIFLAKQANAGESAGDTINGGAYDLVVSAGIGGGFPGRAELASLVLADEIIAADLGVETTVGFSSLEQLGFGPTRIKTDTALRDGLAKALHLAGLPVSIGPVLTVSTVTGTAESAAKLAARIPGAAAEAMEGFGVALAAKQFGLPVLELRAVSNLVGPRNRTAWRIKEALNLLEKACSVLVEELT